MESTWEEKVKWLAIIWVIVDEDDLDVIRRCMGNEMKNIYICDLDLSWLKYGRIMGVWLSGFEVDEPS